MRKMLLSVVTAAAAVAAPGAAQAADTCPNAASRAAQHATGLPDCRAYEMVSPPDKNGNDVLAIGGQSAEHPGAVVFSALGAFGDVASSLPVTGYLARRTDGDGWASQGLLPTQMSNFLNTSQVFESSADLGESVMLTAPTDPQAQPGLVNWVRRDNADGSFHTLSLRANGSTANVKFPVDGSADYGHLAFETEGAFVTGDPDVASVYDGYTDADGTSRIRLASILPGGIPAPNGGTLGALAFGGTNAPNAGPNARNAMSDDGRHVFFSASDTRQIYRRDDGSVTVPVSQTHRSPADPTSLPPLYQLASPDGGQVLFSSYEKLTDDSNASDGATGQWGPWGDLYLYDVAHDQLTDLSASAPTGGALLGVLGAADDFSRIYFVDQAAYGPGAVAGQANIYSWTRDGGIHFIATFAASDWDTSGLTAPQTRVTPDGGHLAFVSAAQLTSYDTNGFKAVYLYDAADDRLVCASCSPSEPRSEAPSTLGAPLPGANRLLRELPDDGSRVFFDSDDALVAADTNGKQDVYEFDAETGQVALLSSGQSSDISTFVDASSDGTDVFFTTRTRLLSGRDTDQLLDLYDARRGGGFAAPPAPPAPCSGDACQGPPPVTSGPTTPVTAMLDGPGNAVPPAPRPPVAPKLSLAKVGTVTGTRARVKVKVGGAGKLSASGSRTGRVDKTIKKAGTVTVEVTLRASARRSLGRHRSLTARITVTFKPASGSVTSQHVTVAFKSTKKTSRRAHGAAAASTKERS